MVGGYRLSHFRGRWRHPLGFCLAGVVYFDSFEQVWVMNLAPLTFIAIPLVMVTTLTMLWQLKRRWVFGMLVLQYLVVLVMVLQEWSAGLAIIKLIVGCVAAAILTSGLDDASTMNGQPDRAGQVFRSIAAAFFWVIIFFSVPALQNWLRISSETISVAFILIGIGLLQLGMTSQPVYVAIGLLTFLSGFEVLYSALEESVLLAGLLAVVNLGIALAGAYLSGMASQEETS